MKQKQIINIVIGAVLIIAIIYIIKTLMKKKTVATPVTTPVGSTNAAGYPSGPSDTTPWVSGSNVTSNVPVVGVNNSPTAIAPVTTAPVTTPTVTPVITAPVTTTPVATNITPVFTKASAPNITNLGSILAQQQSGIITQIVPTSTRRFF